MQYYNPMSLLMDICAEDGYHLWGETARHRKPSSKHENIWRHVMMRTSYLCFSGYISWMSQIIGSGNVIRGNTVKILHCLSQQRVGSVTLVTTPHIGNCGVQNSFYCLTNTSNCLLLLSTSLQGNSEFHLRSIIVMVLSSTTSLVMSAEWTLMDTRYRLWGTRVMILSRDLSFSILLENSTSPVSIFLHSTLYPSKSESGGVQEHAMAVEVWGRQWRLCILSGSKEMLKSWSLVGKGTGVIHSAGTTAPRLCINHQIKVGGWESEFPAILQMCAAWLSCKANTF